MDDETAFAFGIDGAMFCVIFFVIFFVWLVGYLRREDKREGYPKDLTTASWRVLARGALPMPREKVFKRPHGRSTVSTPRREPLRADFEMPPKAMRGHPIRPNRDGLAEGLGPAAWQDRENVPDLNVEGKPKLISLNHHKQYSVAPGDPDPRGWVVIGSDGEWAGEIVDLWFNRAEFFLRYFEVRLANGAETVLLPVFFASVEPRRRRVRVPNFPAARIANAPRQHHPDHITMREEDRVNAFFAGGRFYGADPVGAHA